MKKYQVFVRITGYVEVEAESEEAAVFKVEDDGHIVQEAYQYGGLELEIEDVNEFKKVI